MGKEDNKEREASATAEEASTDAVPADVAPADAAPAASPEEESPSGAEGDAEDASPSSPQEGGGDVKEPITLQSLLGDLFG